tara:strand:- start:828 stop:1046 length:219 start_codon:yes stop_codon:yes gene_type:complete
MQRGPPGLPVVDSLHAVHIVERAPLGILQQVVRGAHLAESRGGGGRARAALLVGMQLERHLTKRLPATRHTR